MKTTSLTIVLLLLSAMAMAQLSDTSITDKTIRNKILEDIQVGLENKTKALDANVSKIDQKVDSLDKLIATMKSASGKADLLLDRVQGLEQRQNKVEENELNVYQANYQSAIINMVSMEREIKPLILFNSTKEFFSALSETSNPLNYEGYQDWYSKFQDYVQKQKTKDPNLNVLSGLLSLTGDISKGIPFSGPITQPLFSGMSSYINTLGSSKREVKAESEKMFMLTAKILQFNHDKDQIELEWTSITKELDELQKHYENILTENLKILSITPDQFRTSFTKENDANRRYNYLSHLRQKSADYIKAQKDGNNKEWKESIYFQMMDVQALKLRFGTITFNISQNIDRYKILIAKYRADPEIGMQVARLDNKLVNLKETFDRAFEPIEYINSATRMYKVL